MVAEFFYYIPETGKVYWKKAPNRRIKLGGEVGSIGVHGYRYTSINCKKVLVHRLVWYLYYGSWPKNEIDHINRIRDDNRILNLRDVTYYENSKNKTKYGEGIYA
jgi:hypothetical protein